MIFVDVAQVTVKAGDGGAGLTSFRREPYVDRGGPDGGDGGDGGSVIFRGDANLNTLSSFRHNQLLRADNGVNGARAKRHGKNGKDLVVPVPLGTVVIGDSGAEIADISQSDQEVVIANGGKGGFGNAHFTSSTRQAPRFAEKGEKGETLEISLELKMIADVGLVGLPNAGKSTLLSVISNAHPEIADYPFTTISPNLGVADIDDTSLLVADIPGLIEGASTGKGLGDEFLRHIERTAVLVHLIDVYSDDVAKDFTTIRNELKSYKVDLTQRPIITALSKTENVDEEIIFDQIKQIQAVSNGEEVYCISAKSKEGLQELLRELVATVKNYRQANTDTSKDEEIPTIRLTPQESDWHIEQTEWGFRVSGQKIERFAARTDFENEEAVQRLRDIMKKTGVIAELLRLGVESETLVQVGASDEHRFHF